MLTKIGQLQEDLLLATSRPEKEIIRAELLKTKENCENIIIEGEPEILINYAEKAREEVEHIINNY